MGRPKLEQDIKLNRRVTFRLTAAELKKLNDAAEICGKSPGTLVRAKLFTGRYPQARMPKLHLHTYTELKKIGVNLNQLTKLAHTGRLSLVDLVKVLMKLERQQETIIARLLYDSHSEDR